MGRWTHGAFTTIDNCYSLFLKDSILNLLSDAVLEQVLDVGLDGGWGQTAEEAESAGRPSKHAPKEAAPAPVQTAAAPRAPRNGKTSASSSPAVADAAGGDRLLRKAEQMTQGAALRHLQPEASSDQQSPKLQPAETELDIKVWFEVQFP